MPTVKTHCVVQRTAEMDDKLVKWWMMLSFPSTIFLLYFFRCLTVHKRHIKGDKTLCAQLYLCFWRDNKIAVILSIFYLEAFLWSRPLIHSFPGCPVFEPLRQGYNNNTFPHWNFKGFKGAVGTFFSPLLSIMWTTVLLKINKTMHSNRPHFFFFFLGLETGDHFRARERKQRPEMFKLAKFFAYRLSKSQLF